MSRTIVVAIVAPLLLGGCARAIAPVSVRGSELAIAQLAGTWEGEYSSEETGRIGSISFQLRAGADTAEGKVVMTSRAEGQAPPSAVSREALGHAVQSEALTIRFVLASGTEVSGVLSPYRDPNCGCTLTTTFRGVISGDVIEGTFETTGSGFQHATHGGRWRVTRIR